MSVFKQLNTDVDLTVIFSISTSISTVGTVKMHGEKGEEEKERHDTAVLATHWTDLQQFII